MSRKRTLTPEEERLWQKVMKGTQPLDPSHGAPVVQKSGPKKAAGKPGKDAITPARPEMPHAPTPPVPKPATAAARAHSLDNLDRQSRKQVIRGKIEVDAKIDLHGMRQSEAHNALISRALKARSDGARVLLVVTGKGGRKGGPSDGSEPFWDRGGGVLKEQVPKWLRQDPLRPMIFSVQQAHQRHGGAGALYVFLKRIR